MLFRMMYAALAAVMLIVCAGCGGGEDPQPVTCELDVTVDAERAQSFTRTLEGDLDVSCNNDVFVGEADGEPDDGAGGAGGAGGAAEKLGTYTCYQYATWEGKGASCEADADCSSPPSPCDVPVCGASKTCALAPVPLGAKLCGSDYFSCTGSMCCGAWPIVQ